MSPFLFFASAMVIPRIVPLASYKSYSVLNTWNGEAFAHEDIERMKYLHRMLAFERFPSPTKGTIGLVSEGTVCAIAQICQPPLTLIDIETSHLHASSGTILVNALASTAPDLQISPTLHARWRIALAYLRSER